MATNTIKVADLARVRDVEFAAKLDGDIRKLQEVLGVFDMIEAQPGTSLKVYKCTGTLASGTVAEGEEIPLSKYTTTWNQIAELDFKKWRKQTTLEAISKRGYSQAVSKTDDQMVKDIELAIRSDLFTMLQGSGSATATGTNFQTAVANTWGKLEQLYEDNAASPVYFVNPLDVASYLGTAQITMQTAFGMSYIEDFMGMGRVIIASNITQGTIIATAQENLNIYYANAAGVEGFDFYTDETGLVGIHHDPIYTNASFETYAVSAVKAFPEYMNRIVKTTITPAS